MVTNSPGMEALDVVRNRRSIEKKINIEVTKNEKRGGNGKKETVEPTDVKHASRQVNVDNGKPLVIQINPFSVSVVRKILPLECVESE